MKERKPTFDSCTSSLHRKRPLTKMNVLQCNVMQWVQFGFCKYNVFPYFSQTSLVDSTCTLSWESCGLGLWVPCPQETTVSSIFSALYVCVFVFMHTHTLTENIISQVEEVK